VELTADGLKVLIPHRQFKTVSLKDPAGLSLQHSRSFRRGRMHYILYGARGKGVYVARSEISGLGPYEVLEQPVVKGDGLVAPSLVAGKKKTRLS